MARQTQIETIKADLVSHLNEMPHEILAMDIGFAYEVLPQVATAALASLVQDGIFKVTGRTHNGLTRYAVA